MLQICKAGAGWQLHLCALEGRLVNRNNGNTQAAGELSCKEIIINLKAGVTGTRHLPHEDSADKRNKAVHTLACLTLQYCKLWYISLQSHVEMESNIHASPETEGMKELHASRRDGV
jgi:hypothetical protein